MAFVIKDRVAETTVTTGTGTVTLLGAVRGYQSFSAIGNTNTTSYLILGGNGTDWEVGVGTYTSAGTTLSRTTILGSSNSGSAISLTGTSLVMCTNPANQTTVNGLFDQFFGAVDGNIIKRQSGVWAGATLAGAGGGLYGPDLSSVPTMSSTNLATWVNQGSATMTDTTEGIFLDIDSAHTGNLCGKKWSAAVPATPYSITVLMNFFTRSATNNPFAMLGWTDGTKFHVLEALLVASAGLELSVVRWSTSSAFSANESGFPGPVGMLPMPLWCQIRDDGTNAIFKVGTSPKSLITVFSVAKASGYLGGSGYTSIFWGGNAAGNGQEMGVELLSWTQGT